jgi:hypothetical protein
MTVTSIKPASAANLNFIRLELARTPEFPQGSSDHRYEFVAPLTKDAHIDAAAWKEVKDRCEVTRVWGAEELQFGLLRHVGKGWSASCVTWGRAGASTMTTRTTPMTNHSSSSIDMP